MKPSFHSFFPMNPPFKPYSNWDSAAPNQIPSTPPGKALLKYIKIPFSHQFSCWLRSRLRSSYQRCSLRLSGVWLRRWLGEIASPPVFRMGKGGRSRLWRDTRLGRESPLCRFQVFPLLILDWLKMVQKNLWKVAPIYPLVNKHI